MKYKTIRTYCLEKWLSNTKRVRDGVHEHFRNAMECKWQNKASDLGLGHVSLFCALGRFNHNITDILTDERFDELDYSITEDKEIIFRQYCKLGLIISESLTDFQDVMVKTAKLNTKKSRKAVSKVNKPEAVDKMLSYINSLFKHKTKGVYKCDHHTTLCFDDLGRDCCLGNVLDIECASQNKCEEDIDTIVIPKMDEMIERVIQAYEKLDRYFEYNPEAFNKLCTMYSDKKELKKSA